MSNKLEIAEWLRRSRDMVLHDYDDEGNVVGSLSSPMTSPLVPQSNDNNSLELPFSSSMGVSLVEAASLTNSKTRKTMKSGQPIRYKALEMEAELDRERSDVDHKFSVTITGDKGRATGTIGRGVSWEAYVEGGRKGKGEGAGGPTVLGDPTPPRTRKRAISGAVIGASSGKEHFMKPRKGLSRGDMVKSRLRVTSDQRVRSNKFNPMVKEVEERLDNLRFDRKMREDLQASITRCVAERKREIFAANGVDSVLVNIERVKQGYYSSDIARIQLEESVGRLKERQEMSARKRKVAEEIENEKADEFFREMLERKRKANALDAALMAKAEVIRARLVRAKKWLALTYVVKVAKIWSADVYDKSADLKSHKIRYDAALRIQNLYRNRRSMQMGQRFRDAVRKLKEFVTKFIHRWRARRLRRGSDLIVQFLVENNAAPIKYMVLQFLAKVKHCQRIWRGFNECTNARVKLLKLFFHKAEELNFQQRKKDLIAEAVERRKIEEELNEDRAKVMKKEDQRRAKEKAKMFGKKGAKKGGGGGHSDRDTAANLKAIEAGLKASIKKAWKNRASAEVKEELCVALLRRKRQEFRDGLATFEERQREREMKNVREIVVDDARELFETGELPIQVRGGEELRLERSDISVSPSTITNNLPLIAARANVGIATNHIGDAYGFKFGIFFDDLFHLLAAVGIEEMREVALNGAKETEQRKWYSRHGLDKNGRRKADSVYVVGEGEDSKAEMLRVVEKEKRHLRDMRRAMVEMEDMEDEDDVVVVDLENDEEVVEEVVEEVDGEVEVAEEILDETEAMEEQHEKEEREAQLLGRFRIVPESVRNANAVVDIMVKAKEEMTQAQRWEKYIGKRERVNTNVKRINVSDLRRGLRKSMKKGKGRN